VTEIVPGGAAFKSGRICVEDILISIDGHHVSFVPCLAALLRPYPCGVAHRGHTHTHTHTHGGVNLPARRAAAPSWKRVTFAPNGESAYLNPKPLPTLITLPKP
jgi:hypothetical protein